MKNKYHLILLAEEELKGKTSRVVSEAEIGEFETEDELLEAFEDVAERLELEEVESEDDE